ncbi:MAG: M48 family metallopeptidase [Deltaproteobacteria bacterium]|nr:M48 family metallopeptidase [Deltaproteobacteria bacterium]
MSKGKKRGYVVDYIGLANHLTEALTLYATTHEQQELAEWRDLNAAAVAREWGNGEAFLYLGRSYRLAMVADQDVDLQLKDGRFRLKRAVLEMGGEEAAKAAFEAFYSLKGEKRISERVAYFSPKVGVRPTGTAVKTLGYRWANCTQKGFLSFHWKCMMAPVRIIDYMVVHELCHLHQRNHTEAFWNEVDKVLPGYRERKMWLRKHGAGLDI